MDNKRKIDDKDSDLLRELEEFKQEKERVKKVLGSLGGASSAKKERLVNIGFLILVLTFFILEVTTHWLPPFVSLELGLLLLSIKIIWMISTTHKVNHFQFWILNSIEFRIGLVDKKLNKLEKEIKELKNEK